MYCKDKARFQKKIKKLGEFFPKGGGGQQYVDFPLIKKNKKNKNAKMIRMV